MKKIQRFEIPFEFDWCYGISIEQLEKDIKALKELGVTEIDMYAAETYGTPYLEITAISERMETDQEYQERIAKEQQKQADQKAWELEQLRKLKAKYE